ncbi:hypothetical protein [Natronorubrum sulfidifaciens]|nr:hypothetical protein [Natronorubrum sulfidifaciens]
MPHRQSRRTVLQTLGSLGTALVVSSTAVSAVPGCDDTSADDDHTRAGGTAPAELPDGATRYIAVVDRIVDGEHVVLLLEQDGDLVDQHVEPTATFDEIAERDILQVVLNDDSLLAYTQLSTRPGRSEDTRDRSLSDLEANIPSEPMEQS